MARQRVTLRDQIMASAQAAMAKGPEHVALVAEIERNSQGPTEATRQPNMTAQHDSPTRQGVITPCRVALLGQSDTTGQHDSPTKHGNATAQPDRITRQPNTTGQRDSPTRQPNTTGQSDRASAPEQIIIPPRSGLWTSAQQTILCYFEEMGSHVTTYNYIAEKTGISLGTLRQIIRKMIALGILQTQPWSGPGGCGLRFTFFAPATATRQGNQTGQHDRAARQGNATGQPDRVTRQGKTTWQRDRANASYKEEIDRFSLSISQERVELTWPNLARSGFGREQLNQIGQALAELGKPADKIMASLDHAEWELEHGQMTDKEGQPVADPCSWVFRSLARTGYYRRPKGYVSPEEQAAKDAEAEAKAVTAARHAAEQAQFEAWRDGLSPDELADAMRGHPGGPKDAWLKSAWKKNNSIQ